MILKTQFQALTYRYQSLSIIKMLNSLQLHIYLLDQHML